jgi:hypothetical protein
MSGSSSLESRARRLASKSRSPTATRTRGEIAERGTGSGSGARGSQHSTEEGHVTTRGAILARYVVARDRFEPIEPPNTLAITGGTEAYDRARGQISEGEPKLENRLLDIQL